MLVIPFLLFNVEFFTTHFRPAECALNHAYIVFGKGQRIFFSADVFSFLMTKVVLLNVIFTCCSAQFIAEKLQVRHILFDKLKGYKLSIFILKISTKM